jgi:pilus assembly protein CpaC
MLLRRRARGLWAITLGAASLGGQVLLADDPPPPTPQAIVNQHVQAAAAQARPTKAAFPAQSPAALRSVGIEEVHQSPLDLVSATVQAMAAEADAKPAEPKLIEARPLPLNPLPTGQLAPVVLPGMVRSPHVPQRAAARAAATPKAVVQPASAEDEPQALAPIVPSWALPRPLPRLEPIQNAEFRTQKVGAPPQPATALPAQRTEPHQPEKITFQPSSPAPGRQSVPESTSETDVTAEPILNSDFRILNPKPVTTADFETGIVQPAPAQPNLVQPPALAPPAAIDEGPFGVLPAGSPFEAIPESGEIRIRVRRSLLLRTRVDIRRTAIVDDSVCDIVQFTPREVSIIGRSLGQTHVTFWFDDPAMAPLTYLVKVEPDAAQIKQDEDKYKLLENVINEMFPDSKVYLVLVADKLLVKGQAKDSEEAAQIMTIIRAQGIRSAAGFPNWGGLPGIADAAATPVLSQQATGGNAGPQYQIINMLRVPGVQQVALKVKIADLNRTAARGFGVDVNAAIDLSDSVEGSRLFLASLLNASSTGGTSLLTSFSGDDVSIGIRYLQERGVVKLLSEPTLVTLSGRPATFIAGGEFAVPTVVGSVGLNSVTTDFRSFGAIISFLPTIVDKDRIRLQVAPEFSQINTQLAVNGTPGLNVRAATTTVEMREGQTLAIAGLMEDSYKASNIGDLPGLAKLFGRRDTSRTETELIILVTPELVHPMDPEEVPPLPGFDITEPTAARFFFHGDIEGNPTRDHRSTVWPRLRKRYGMGGPAMTSGPFGHGQ